MSKQRFCTNCGKPLKEGARFCSFCGHDVTEDEPNAGSTPRDTEAMTPADTQQNAEAKNAEAKPAKMPRKKHGAVIAVCIAAAVLAASAGGYFGWKAYQDHLASEAQQAYDDAHALVSVGLSIVAPNYTQNATRIPLHVTGTDLDGNGVDTVAYVGVQDSLSLQQGTYEVRPVTSPILEDGTIYTCSTDLVPITVGAGASSWDASTNSLSSGSTDADAGSVDESNASDTSSDSSAATITFEVPDAAEVTDQMIADAKQAAAQDPEDNGKAETLSAAATKKRDDAVAAAKAAAQKAAAEKAAQEKKAWYQKYASIIQSQKEGIDELNGSNSSYARSLRWALWDIDGDGSPELITRCDGDSMDAGDNISCVAGISGGTPNELVPFLVEARDWYFLGSDGVLRETGSGGASAGGDDYYTITSSGAHKYATVQWDRTDVKNDLTYSYAEDGKGNGYQIVDEAFRDQYRAKHPTKPLSDYDWTTDPLG